MKVKALELRDTGTFIPILCVDMNPGRMGTPVYGAQRYLLRRCGYACDGHPRAGGRQTAGLNKSGSSIFGFADGQRYPTNP
jgi:hypothetical protein